MNAALLQHDPDLLAELARAASGIDSQDPCLTRRAGSIPLQDLDDGRLAGAVGAEQAEHLAARDVEAHPAHGLRLAVRAPEVAHLDGEARSLSFHRM